ncbi:MAG: NfeD family protein [Chloroflexi bacterium]|nr:NfeD family protein [Chloroflexota bacterium]
MWCHLLLLSPVLGLGLFLILPWTTALPLYLVILALSFFLYAKIMQTRSVRQPVMTGQEALLGQTAEIELGGSLKVAGERWLIAQAEGLAPGQRVHIVGFSGLRLEVQPVDE